MPLVTIVIGWQGPFALERIYESHLGNGLYFVSGLTKHKKKNEIRYFGITERNSPRPNKTVKQLCRY
jgi:hypothetical protein